MAVTLNLLAIPLLAGLVAGTGAIARYVGEPASAPAATVKPCSAQTWPYIDAKCLTRVEQRPVRLVTAPRTDDTAASATDGVPPVPGPQDQLATPSGLTSSDTVLRQPGVFVPAKDPKARAKRSERRSQRLVRSYQVPSEARPGSGATIVVRPLRLEQFR
jgi:hypothetical protein